MYISRYSSGCGPRLQHCASQRQKNFDAVDTLSGVLVTDSEVREEQ